MDYPIAEQQSDSVSSANGTLERLQKPLVVRTPRSDHWEDKDGTNHLYIDLPGVSEEDLSLSVESKVMTVEGIKKALSSDARSSTKYERKFRLSDELDANSIEAELNSGVLKVKIPRRPETKRKIIEISIRN